MTTNARPVSENSAHWYDAKSGEPRHTVIGKTTGKPRPTTIADARKEAWLPSVTTILGILDKPALTNWKIEQAVLAAATTPKELGEELDAFIKRVLTVDAKAEQEKARDLGSSIHAALENLFSGWPVEEELFPWVNPAFDEIRKRGNLVACERRLVGDGYAGCCDLILQVETNTFEIWDWKTTKRLPPKGAWDEHRLQGAAYGQAFWKDRQSIKLKIGNVYISTVEQGAFVIHEHPGDWRVTYEQGFKPLVAYWQWVNNYNPAIVRPF